MPRVSVLDRILSDFTILAVHSRDRTSRRQCRLVIHRSQSVRRYLGCRGKAPLPLQWQDPWMPVLAKGTRRETPTSLSFDVARPVTTPKPDSRRKGSCLCQCVQRRVWKYRLPRSRLKYRRCLEIWRGHPVFLSDVKFRVPPSPISHQRTSCWLSSRMG